MASMTTTTALCRLSSVHCSRFSPCGRLQLVSNLPIKPRQVRLSKATTIVGFADSFPSMAKMLVPPLDPRTPHSSVSLTIVSKKGYKMKTHKVFVLNLVTAETLWALSILVRGENASAKRFRVTGNGKIMRRRAGKQHLLVKKNTKRKNRLSKMQQVSKSDYNNVIGALPYLKVNRQAS